MKFHRPRRSFEQDIKILSNGIEFIIKERCITTSWGKTSEIWDEVGDFTPTYFASYADAKRYAMRLVGKWREVKS